MTGWGRLLFPAYTPAVRAPFDFPQDERTGSLTGEWTELVPGRTDSLAGSRRTR